MNKRLKKIIAFILCFLFAFPCFDVFAAETQVELNDLNLSESEVNELLNSTNSLIEPYANNLIVTYGITIIKNGTDLVLAGRTDCLTSVVKCGFKKVVIQRKLYSSSTWSDYLTYENLYIDTWSYTLSKSVPVQAGYQYRVTCIHYAKKNIFSTQKLNNISNVLTF